MNVSEALQDVQATEAARTPRNRPPPVTRKRRMIDPTTCERDYRADEVEFMNAMQVYKDSRRRMFPTWSEALEVLLSLGYVKTPIPLKVFVPSVDN